MAVYTTLRVVNKNTGVTVFDVDENGVRDGTNRVFQASEFIFDRLFATPLAAYMWTCLEGVWQVAAVNANVSVTGGAGTTVQVLVCASGVAPGSGTAQLTTALDIEETAPFAVNGVLIASPTQIFPGMSVSRLIAGTVASVEGLLTVQLKRVG
jgi:hypothetical protein